MLGITDLATYVLGTVFIILLPGPNSIYVLSVAARRGVRAGYQGAAAVVIGDSVLMVLAAAGVGSLLAAYPQLFAIIKYAGGAYLGWIGLQLILGAIRKPDSVRTGSEQQDADQGQTFKKALVVSLLNPKAMLFFVSFFIQFVDPVYAHPALTFVILGAIFQVLSLIYLSVLIFAGARLAAAFRRRVRLVAAMKGGVGALFIGFGAKLATASIE